MEAAQRSLDQVSVAALARIERDGVFTEHGYRSPSGALADLLRWEPRRSRRFVTAAEQIVARVGLDGQTLPARLEATADGAAHGQFSMRHVEVIAGLLDSAPVWSDGRTTVITWERGVRTLRGPSARSRGAGPSR